MTNVIFDKRSAKAVEQVVLQVLASDPRRRGAPRKLPRPVPGDFIGVLGIAMNDFTKCKVTKDRPADGTVPEDYDPVTDPPLDAPTFTFGSGTVQRVELAAPAEDGLVAVRGAYDSNNQPLTETWYNTVTAPIHRGRLLQGKHFPLPDGTLVVIVDVEPCD